MSKDSTSIFIKGKEAWDALYGGALSMSHFWRNLALLSVSVNLVLSGGFIWETRQSRIVPYVVEVDKLGQSVPIRPATRVMGINSTIKIYTVSHFLTSIRSMSIDSVAERTKLEKAYTHLARGTQAYKVVSDFLQARETDKSFKDVAITVHIKDAIPQDKDTIIVHWSEKYWLPDGRSMLGGTYEAYVTTVVKPPSKADTPEFQENPLGIYITRISWSEVK
jgi:Type IV secretory pathway, TrbF components